MSTYLQGQGVRVAVPPAVAAHYGWHGTVRVPTVSRPQLLALLRLCTLDAEDASGAEHMRMFTDELDLSAFLPPWYSEVLQWSTDLQLHVLHLCVALGCAGPEAVLSYILLHTSAWTSGEHDPNLSRTWIHLP